VLTLSGVAETSSGEPGSARPVDPRLLHDNERTLLAWVRTGLSLITFGFVLVRVEAWLHATARPGAVLPRSIGTDWIGVGFIAVGSLANGLALLRFLRTRRALRSGAELPTDIFPIAFTAVVTLLGVTLALYILTRLG
jgi:putative membrane protein